MAAWLMVDNNTQILGTGISVETTFAAAPFGCIGIHVTGNSDILKDRLAVIATSQSQTKTWIQDADLAEDSLVFSMEGFDKAVDSEEETSWTLSLGQYTDKGLMQYTLKNDKARSVTENPVCGMYDFRRYSGDLVRLSAEGGGEAQLAVYTDLLGKRGQLQLQIGPAENRYRNIVACEISGAKRLEDGRISLTVKCPDTVEQPQALSVMRLTDTLSAYDQKVCVAEASAVGVYDESHSVTGVIDLRDMPAQEGLWQLSCVLGYDEDTPLMAPLFLTEKQAALDYAEAFEGRPVCDSADGKHCWLLSNNSYRALAVWSDDEPGTIDLSQTKESYEDSIESLRVSASHVSGGDWRWTIRLSERKWGPEAVISLIAVAREDGRKVECPAKIIKTEEKKCTVLEADVSSLKETIESCVMKQWAVFISVRCKDKLLVLPLADPGHISINKKMKEGSFLKTHETVEPVGSVLFKEKTVEITPSSAVYGNWRLCIGEVALRHSLEFRCIGEDVKLSNKKLCYKLKCPDISGADWKGMMLSFRHQLEADRSEHYCAAKRVFRDGGDVVMITEISLDSLDLKPIIWDVRAVYEKDGEQFWVSVKTPKKATNVLAKSKKQAAINALFFTQTVKVGDDCCMSLGETKDNDATLVVQKDLKYYGFKFRLKERIATGIYMLMRKKLLKQGVYLVYEKFCSMAQDNGYYFFKYCMDNDMESVMNRRIYYVIDKSQKDYENLKPYKDHVIQFMSMRHMVLLLAARLLISSDSKQHAYAWRAMESIIRPTIIRNKRSVFLQHGVIGLKRLPYYKRGTGTANLFITSNEMERGFVINDLQYLPEQVAVTGLARWDVLKDKSAGVEPRQILVMPTWRKWLEETTDNVFLESEYYHKYMELINSPVLAEILERYDLCLNFYIHPKMREHLGKFSAGGRIRLIPFGSEPLNELIMTCKLLITDYSSVCWDVYYQGKPVIFYQFDLDKYNQTQGAYMDLEKDLFGERTESLDELLRLLERSAENEFELDPEYAEIRQEMFGYIDHNNSKRTCEEIIKRGW